MEHEASIKITVQGLIDKEQYEWASKFLKGLRWNKMREELVYDLISTFFFYQDKLPDWPRIFEKAILALPQIKSLIKEQKCAN